MEANCLSLGCCACCSRYWITLLPREAKAIAKALGLGDKEFIEKKCLLVAHVYPARENAGLIVNSGLLPARIAAFAEHSLGALPQYFLVLPSLALRRNRKGECVLLRSGRCEVHDAAPAVCKLFPFVALGKRPLREAYPFCAALQQKGFGKMQGSLDEAHAKKINDYFAAVGKNGFSVQWGHLPTKGVLLLGGELELPLSKKEFLQLVGPFI
jgi:Fe-S-cluster containining protein